MKQGWAFAWRSLMAAEIYVTILTGFGLRYLLHYGRELNAMDQVIEIMLVIVIIGLLADKILFTPIERFYRRSSPNLDCGATATLEAYGVELSPFHQMKKAIALYEFRLAT